MKTEETMNRGQRRTRRRDEQGTSLIEIMVVLVIVLIGIFLAIRVFPVGFGVLRANGNRTLATQLAENTMGFVKGESAGMPGGVLLGYPQSGALTFSTNASSDDLTPCRMDAVGNPCAGTATDAAFDPTYDDINKFRYIKGEAVKVPMVSPTAFGSGALYTLKFGPAAMDPAVGTPTNVPTAQTQKIYDSYLRVSGGPLRGITVTSTDQTQITQLTDGQTYLIYQGSDGVKILLPPRAATTPARSNPNRTFNITVTYYNGSQVVTADADPITVADNDATFKAITVTINNMQLPVKDMIPASEVVSRSFTRIASTATFDTADPYQYKLLSANINANVAANVGVLSFNPSGSSYTVSSTEPFMAYVDYMVYDWHIIRDDRQVPPVLPVTATADDGGTVNLIPIRTTLRSIKQVGGPEPDGTFYRGIFNVSGPNTDSNPKDFQVYLLDATPASGVFGQPLTNGSTIYSLNGGLRVVSKNAFFYMFRDYNRKRGASSGGKDSSYDSGVVYVNADATRLPVGTRIRMMYKAVGDWGVAVQKAYARYTPDLLPNGTLAPFPLKGQYYGYAASSSATPANAQIRLPYTDLNKSVSLTIQYTKQNGEVVRLSPVQVTVNQTGRATAGTDASVYDLRYAYANIAEAVPLLNRADFLAASNWQVVGPIRGVSVKTRVIWHDNDTPKERWHVQDLDSYLDTTLTQ